jgi:hypothetical protein
MNSFPWQNFQNRFARLASHRNIVFTNSVFKIAIKNARCFRGIKFSEHRSNFEIMLTFSNSVILGNKKPALLKSGPDLSNTVLYGSQMTEFENLGMISKLLLCSDKFIRLKHRAF